MDLEGTRSQRLRHATHGAHEALDQRIMAAQPFANRDRYRQFLRMQYRFLGDLDALYKDPRLAGVIPDLAGRNRMERVLADLEDLGLSAPDLEEGSRPQRAGLATALGWLYVAEGSKLGAAILLRQVSALGVDEGFGARHLAGHTEGRARHWREFTAALDALPLSPEQEKEVVLGARTAFDRVRAHAEREFGS